MAYPTLADVKAFMGITTSADDAVLSIYLSASIAWAQNYCNRVFVADVSVRSLGREHLSQDRRSLKDVGEFVSISSIVAVGTLGWLLQPSSYRPVRLGKADGPYELIELKSGAVRGFFYGDTVEVEASWGYSTACPFEVRQAILYATEGQYRKRQSRVVGVQLERQNATIGEATALPGEAYAFLANYVRAR